MVFPDSSTLAIVIRKAPASSGVCIPATVNLWRASKQTLRLGSEVGHTFRVSEAGMPASLHMRVNSRMDVREKKIWTNEDIPLLRQAAPISIFAGNSTAQPNTAEGAGAEVESPTQPYVISRLRSDACVQPC